MADPPLARRGLVDGIERQRVPVEVGTRALAPLGTAPRTPTNARKWVRLASRRITMLDALHLLHRTPRVEAHPDPPRHGGTCWRVIGRHVDGERTIAVGVEAFHDERGHRLMLCTVIDTKRGER